MPFSTQLLTSLLKNCIFEKEIIFRDIIDSTNVFLKNLAQQGSPEGTVVIADEQSTGLGRLGRPWFSKKGANLLFSVLLRPGLPPNQIFVLTMIFALAGIDAVQQMTRLNAMIKWPNDIYIGHKKLGGILTEFAVKKGVVQHVVLGMGLNVNWKPSSEKMLLYPATSIFAETKKMVSREELLSKILKYLDKIYREVLEDNNPAVRFYEKWNDKSTILGKSVVIETGKERFQGEVAGIDPYGALTLIAEGGHERKFVCGDVSVKMNFSEP
jgi:BirA family transcriptional regulator, biotin operon repressor / biotin---[acetyl-CoA-carboxylase] ligase